MLWCVGQLLFSNTSWDWTLGPQREGVLSDCGIGTILFNNSSWDWQLGLQREGVLSDCGIGCCVAMSAAAFCLTTRLGIGSLDFRGKACCPIAGSVAVL